MTEKKKKRTVAGLLLEDGPLFLLSIVMLPIAPAIYCAERSKKSRNRLISVLWALCVLPLILIGCLPPLGFAVLIGRYFYISMPLLILSAWYTDKKYGRSF